MHTLITPTLTLAGTVYSVSEQYESPVAHFTTREAAVAHAEALNAAYRGRFNDCLGDDYYPTFAVGEVKVYS